MNVDRVKRRKKHNIRKGFIKYRRRPIKYNSMNKTMDKMYRPNLQKKTLGLNKKE